MKMYIYSVFDKAVNAYMQPFYARSGGEAIRSFTELANDPQTNVGRHPNDFVLFALGAFDDNSGLFEGIEPARIHAANEVVRDALSAADVGLELAQRGRQSAADVGIELAQRGRQSSR